VTYQKMIISAVLVRCRRDGRDEIDVPGDIAERIRGATRPMIEVGNPGSGE
jgi:quinolinate synthase